MEARRVAASVVQGAHGRRRTGPGESFWQFRHAQPGDAAAGIDWRQSARTDQLFLRESEWSAAQTVWLWRDGSASMNWRSDPSLPSKRHRAELLILALAALLIRGGERLALLDGGLAPTSGEGALGRLVAALERPVVERADIQLSRHSSLVLIGDFLDPLDQLAARLSRLGGSGHLVQVLDPAEESLPYDGRVRFRGMEGEGEMLARRAEDLRPAYVTRLAAHRDGLAALARSAGWSFATHRTDQPPQHALLALFAQLAGERV